MCVRLLPDNRILLFNENHMAIHDIPDFDTVQASSSQYLGSYITPCNSTSLPGTMLTGWGPSGLCFGPMDVIRFAVSTDVGIYAVTISPTICSINLLHALVDLEQRDPDISLSFGRAFIRYHGYALGVSYEPRWASVSSEAECVKNTSSFRCSISKATPVYTKCVMDETSGRVVMADSKKSLTVLYFSLYDLSKE